LSASAQTRRWLIVVLIAAIATGRAVAESPASSTETGILAGKLTDTHSVPLAEAVVVVRNLTTGATTSSVTGRNGSYRFTNLGPGEYRLEADVPQLGKGAVEGILISAGHATRVQAALVMELPPPPPEPEPQQEAADARELDPVSPAVTTTLSNEELQSVPVGSRNWQAFEAITPAASPSAPGGGRGSGQIGDEADGGEEAASQPNSKIGPVTIETVGEIDGIDSPPAFHLQGDRSERLSQALGTSAVQAIEARTGDSTASQGSATGGSVNLITNSGHNGLHGQFFYTDRQGFWGARNPFTQWVKETAQASGSQIAAFAAEPYSPNEIRQTFGLGAGRQIRRDKAFWFAALDGFLRNDPAVATVRHPDSFFRQPTDPELLAFAARLGLPSADRIDEAAKAYSSGVAGLTGPAGLEALGGLLGPVSRSTRQWQGFGRVDWLLTERQHLSVEGDGASLDAPGGGLSRSSETYGSNSFGNSHGTEAWALVRWNSFLSADLLNAAAVQFRRHLQNDSPQRPSAFEQSLLQYSGSPLPEIIADSTNGFVLGQPARLGGSKAPDERLLSAQDTLSWVHGPHLIKAGASFDHVSDAVDVLFNQAGTYDYANAFNFISDSSTYLAQKGFAAGGTALPAQHNCDATGHVPALPNTQDTGTGPYPCYAWYSQRIGPADWHLSSNDLAAFATEQWQPLHNLTLSAGFRVEKQQLPPPIASTVNPDLALREHLPSSSLQWGPRIGVAWSAWPGGMLRAGAGIYFGRIDNSAILAALTQTGSLNGDLNYFFKPTDVGAPPFPYVFPGAPQDAIKPGAVFFGPHFRPQEVDQAVVNIEQQLPSHWLVSVSGMASLGRRLPVSVDTNLASAHDAQGNARTITYEVVDPEHLGPVKTATITAPFYTARDNTNYQQLDEIESRANSTYEAGLFKIVRYGGNGLSMHAHYLYAHAMDWNPNETGQVAVNDVLDPNDFSLEYGVSNLDIRHSVGATVLYRTPWKLRDWAGYWANGWSIAAVGQFRSGLPFTIRTGGYIPGFYESKQLIEGVGPGMNGSAGDNRIYGIGRNTYRYPATWKADARLAKRFNLAHSRQLELFGESFNLFNHQNVTLIETTGYILNRGSVSGGPPTFTFLTGSTATGATGGAVEFGKPLDVNATNFFRQREFQVGLRARF
jgi:hypothetical protein